MVAYFEPRSLWAGQALIDGEWRKGARIGVRDGLVSSVELDTEPSPSDDRHGIIVPGLPNLHSHAFQRGMAGLTEVRGHTADSFWTWREVMYRFVDRMGPDELQAIAALAYVEMLESGFTRVGEFHYVHHDPAGAAYSNPARMGEAIVAAAEESGIALTHLPVFYAWSGFGGREPQPGQRRFIHGPDGYAKLVEASRVALQMLPDSVLGIAPHSLRAVTPEDLNAILPMAADGPIHIHVAEQLMEVQDCLQALGARPVEWLLANAPVDVRWCLVHATHMTERECHDLAGSGATAGLCPITEANLGDGLFPAVSFAKAGGRIGIGSDSNILIDAWEELRWLEYGQRLFHHSRNMLGAGAGCSTGGDLFRTVLEGGAAALGAKAALRIGDAADFVSLSADHPSLIGREADLLLDSAVFVAGREAVDCVWRRGKRLVTAGRHHHRDTIQARYRRALEGLI